MYLTSTGDSGTNLNLNNTSLQNQSAENHPSENSTSENSEKSLSISEALPETDSIELTSSFESLAFNRSTAISLNNSFGTYSISSEIKNRISMFQMQNITGQSLQISNNNNNQTNQMSIDFAALRENISKNLINHFGLDSDVLGQFHDTSDWMQSASPELYQGMMVLISMLSEENPEMAKNLIENAGALKEMFEGANLNTGQENSFSVMMFNFEASLQASRSTFSAGDYAQYMEENFSVNININLQQVFVREEDQVQIQDPLILDIDGNGIDLKSAEDGVNFDIEGSGENAKTAFIQGDDAMLFVDYNNNGVADNGRELFGDQEGDAHGFAKLARYDENNDGVIDSNDSIYDRLRLFQDLNGDGINQKDETKTLSDLSVKKLILSYAESHLEDESGNILTQISQFEKEDGTRNMLADAMLRYYK